MSGWSCEWDGVFAYRERIAISDGTTRCCESGILIPEGFPFADCHPGWWDGDTPYIEGHDPEEPDAWPTHILLPHLNPHPQAIEIWRKLRNDSANRGVCPRWGTALDDYSEAWEHGCEQEDRLALLQLKSIFKRTALRYREGKQPRLNPNERESLATGEYVRAIPFGRTKKVDGKE